MLNFLFVLIVIDVREYVLMCNHVFGKMILDSGVLAMCLGVLVVLKQEQYNQY